MAAAIQVLLALILVILCFSSSKMTNKMIHSALSTFNFVGSLFFCKVINHPVEFQQFYDKYLKFLQSHIGFISFYKAIDHHVEFQQFSDKILKFLQSNMGFISFCKVIDQHVELQQFSGKILKFLQSHMGFIARLKFGFKDKGHGGVCGPEVCTSCRKEISSEKSDISTAQEGALTREDIEIVMERLGMGSCWEDVESRTKEKCRDCRLLEDVTILLEAKEANLEELEEAFSVFDENADGFINAIELQRVMCSLEFKEGINLEDCHRMIQVFDENGDGCIDFHEFKNMMENGK